MKKDGICYPIVLFILLLLTMMFANKYVYLAPNLNVSESMLIYPFTFLIVALMYKKYNMRYVRKTLFIGFILIIIFYLLMSIFNTIDGITSSNEIANSLREIFTPFSFTISDKFIYYPDIALLLTFTVIYFISHFIFITIYEAIEGITNHLIGFILSIMIGFTLDRILFVPLSNIPYIIDGTLSYESLIELMTANFITLIFSSLIILGIYAIAYKKVNKI